MEDKQVSINQKRLTIPQLRDLLMGRMDGLDSRLKIIEQRHRGLDEAAEEMVAEYAAQGGFEPDDAAAPPELDAEQHMREALVLLGVGGLIGGDLDKTPKRFIKYLMEFCKPFDAREILGTLFEGPKADSIHGMVLQKDIPFRMICSHHLLPALGKAHVGYIPNGKVVGLSKLGRLVDAIGTSKPGMQELICEEITDALNDYTQARGTMVVLRAEHGCMACRGLNAPGVPTTTSCVRGVFSTVPAARSEFLALLSL